MFWVISGQYDVPGLALFTFPVVLMPFAFFGLLGFVRNHDLQKVLRNGQVLAFAGRPRNLSGLDFSQNILRQVKLWNDQEHWMEVEVYAESHQVRAVNGRRPTRRLSRRCGKMARVAPVPRQSGRRPLTELERIELTQHITRYRGPSKKFLVAMVTGLTAILAALIAIRHFGSIVHFLLSGGLVYDQLYLARKGRPLAEKLQNDLDAGFIAEGPSSGVLQLGVSGIPWIIDGLPSEWRTAAPPDIHVRVPQALDHAIVRGSQAATP